MRTINFKSAVIRSVLTAAAFVSAAGTALAQQQVNLNVAPSATTLSDGTVVQMWGYNCGAAVTGSTAACAASNPAIAAAQAAVTAGTATAGQAALAAAWSPVVITVPSGQDLQINLTNSLSFNNGNTIPTSLVVAGQIGGGLGAPTYGSAVDHSAVRAGTWPTAGATPPASAVAPVQGQRVRSFATELAIPAGSTSATASLTWKGLQPGTYLIQSGTHPSIQVPMGLYGVLVVTDAQSGTAYGSASAPKVKYAADVPLVFSEIDPVQNNAVAAAVNTAGFSESRVWSGLPDGCGNPVTSAGTTNPAYNTCYPPTVNYTPLYYLINGSTFDSTHAAASLYPVSPLTGATGPVGGNVLVRLVNAGLRMHVPSIVGATTGGAANTPGMSLVAEDGNVLPGQARIQNHVFLAAGKTHDVLINAPAAGSPALAIYDRQLSLSANATGRNGGMLAYIGINGSSVPGATAGGAMGAATANPDTYSALVAGQPLTISDPAKGVIANDVRVSGVALLTQASSGTVNLNSNGTFTYTPNSGSTATSDSFTYCANGTVAGGTCSSGITAKVTLAQSIIAGAGVTCSASSFDSSVATYIFRGTPGLLASCSDGANLPLTVAGAPTLTPIALTPTNGATGTGTVVIDANGGFTATTTAPGTYTFSYRAQNSQNSLSSDATSSSSLPVTSTTVTLNFKPGSGLAVTVLDGADHTSKITDYRWIIEEDRTFYVDPACTSNPLPAGCPTNSSTDSRPINYGTNFHTSSIPVVAAGCTGPLSCENGQTMQGLNVVCDVGNGVCRPGTQQATVTPDQVALDPAKRYYISILPGDAANPFINGYTGAPDCTAAGAAAGQCGHGMGGAPIAAACGPQSASKLDCSSSQATTTSSVTILTVPTPLPTATLSVIVYQDDYPLNNEQGPGGGVDVLAPQEAGLGGFQITIFDQAGGTGDATGQPTYDMFNQPLSNALAGTVDPVTGLDACPISDVASANAAFNRANAAAIAAGSMTAKSESTGMIVTCPKYESDGKTLSPMAGQALVKNLYAGRYGIAALPGQDRIARGEEWVQTNTLDGQKAHDSFMRVGEPGYFQEFGPAGYHVSIGFANPKIINDRRYNDSQSGMCDTGPKGGNMDCHYEVTGRVTGSRLSRAPDNRLYSSGGRESLAFTQCYVALSDPDGATIAFSKCDADGYFDFKGIPAGNWSVTTFDQWNDQIIDGITQPVAVGCANSVGGLCTIASGPATGSTTCGGPKTGAAVCDMGEIGAHQWQSNIYTRTFIDLNGDGVSQDSEPGVPLAATNIRFRDGSYSNFNNTDLSGNAGFNEVFPLFNWYVIESDDTRYKTTGVHVVYDAGGPADGSSSCGDPSKPNQNPLCGNSAIAAGLANTYENFPLPANLSVPGAVYCATGNADCAGESIALGPKLSSTSKNSTGRIDPPFWFNSYGWQGYIGQGNFLEFGKKAFADGETGPIHGHVVYASTRPFDDPRLLLQLSWEPLIANVTVNLYRKDVAADGVTSTLTLVDTTQTTSWDDWVQGYRKDANGNMLLTTDKNGKNPGDSGYVPTGIPNMNCPGQQGSTDPFFYALQDQPHYLDWYNSQHGGPAATSLPYQAQYKCYDGMHTWNQLQPAPYDGKYSFPSVKAFDPVTGKPMGTNCTGCIPNPDTTDPYRAGTPMLPPGKYVVEVVVPQGYELVKEEDKNILIGDNYIAPAALQFPGLGSGVYILPDQAQLAATYNPLNAQNSTTSLGRNAALPSHEGDTGSDESYWPCAGAMRQVPDFISLFPQSGQVAPFAGAMRPLCDRKEVTLNEQTSVLTKFYLFSSTHKAAHFQGIILDDFAAEFDPFSPQFGEKFAPSYLPVGVKDWTGNPVNRVYTDQFGLYNGLNYSTWEVNPPNPTGYAPTMMVYCMNDAGLSGTPDPLHQPGYSQFCYELPSMPGQTGYFDTPVVPVSAFASGSYNRPDCSYPDATPAVGSVTGDVAGPWVSAPSKTITIAALGNQDVDWYGYTGPSQSTAPWNIKKVTRHYGFGDLQGTVTIGGVAAPVTSWTDGSITVTVPAGVPACAVQQQAIYGGSNASCGQLVITTAAGKQSIDTVTVTIGGKAPTVLAAGASIQGAIDAAAPGDLIVVPPGTYNEMLVMWKPVRLQGVGAASSIVDANTQPAGKLLNPWRSKVVCLFGLTADGRPDTSANRDCVSGLNFATNAEPGTSGYVNFPNLVVDRLPLEATLGWDAGLNGNLAEQIIEPSLLGAYEGAVVTVIGKGVKFPTGTQILDAFGATTATPAAFPDNSVFLTSNDCGPNDATTPRPYPSNFYCNPSSIDGLTLRDSSQGGGGIFVHSYAHKLQIANNRVTNNQGTMSGGMTIGAGEHGDIQLAGSLPTQYPASCETSNVTNLSLPFCFNTSINIHHNAVVANSSLGDEIFSSTPAGAGGVSINTGSDYYRFSNNWVCGNLSSGDGGGVSHIGFSKNGAIERNTIVFNQSTNPTITTNGGGLLVMGAPDADPTNCGVSTDQDCVATANLILPSDGTGHHLTINANLILGNAADSGSGGGVRIQHVNGTDVLNLPNGAANCSADLGFGTSNASKCYWNSVNFTNNIVVNNVAGWDGGGVSLLDALAVNVVNNTIASNDSTASSGTLFQSLFAPLASSVAPTSNVVCGATNGQSCPQVAGLVSLNNSPVLAANIGNLPAATPISCPPGHGVGTGVGASCSSYSVPLLLNDVIWQNRSFYIGVGGFGLAAANQNQQHVVALYNASFDSQVPGTPAATQSVTGGCPAGSSYWEIGYRGDTIPTAHDAAGFAPINSILSAATYGGSANSTSNPSFASLYCNGSRVPPEIAAAGSAGYAVPPGVNEFNAFPNPVFSLTPAGVVDEGNNWVNVRWGPLALTNPATNAVLGNYAPALGSPAIDHGVANANNVPTVALDVAAPTSDFFGNPRPSGAGYDIGAVEYPGLALSPSAFDFGNVPVLTTSAAKVFTLSNPATGQPVSGLTVSLAGANAADYAISANNCGANLAAGTQCTISVTFTPNLLGARTATLVVTDSQGTQSASLAGAGTGAVYSVTPASLTFPNTVVNTVSAAQTLTVRNNQPTSMQFTQQALGGLFGGQYAIAAGTTCNVGTIVASAGTCVINLTFNPQAVAGFGGIRPANLALAASGLTTNVALNGTAILFPVDVTPKGLFGINGTLNFPNTQVGQTSAALVATLSNYQSSPVTVNSIAMPSQFKIVSGPSTTCVNGAVLPAAAADGTPTTCTVAIDFAPTAPGPLLGFWTQTATLNLSGSGGVNPTVTLNGTAVNPQATFSPASLSFPLTAVGSSSAVQTVTLTNTGVGPFTVTPTTAGPFAQTNNCVSPLAVGAACTFSVTFNPTAVGASEPGTLSVTNGTNAVALSGSAKNLLSVTASPAAVTFAQTLVGNSTTQTLTLTNTGMSPYPLSGLTGVAAPFSLQSNTCGGTVPVTGTATCTVTLAFTPTTTGSFTGSLAIASGTPATVSLSGSSVAQSATFTSTTLAFAQTAIGSTRTGTVTLRNNTAFAMPITATFTGPYSLQTTGCGGTLPAGVGSTCVLTVAFAPTSGGAQNGTLAVSNATNNPVTLTGTGPTGTRTPTTLNFLALPGQQLTRTVTVTNNGTVVLPAPAYSVTGTNATRFTVTGCTTPIAAGGNCTLTVVFNAPTGLGAGTATLNLPGWIGSVALNETW